MTEIQSLTARVQQLGDAVDVWNRWMLWGLVFAALAAVWIGLTTRLTIVRSKQLAIAQGSLDKAKEAQLSLELKDKDRQIAEVKSESDTKTAGLQARAKEADARIAESEKGSAEANERAKKAQASLSMAEQHSAEANAKAEGFRLDIAKANESAEQARAQVAGATAEAAKANLELAKLKTPRSLTKEQQERVSSKLLRFFDITYCLWVSTDADSTNLMNSIDDAVRAAKWTPKPAGDIQFAGKAGVIAQSGITIRFADESRERLERPALALADALKAEGIPVTAVFSDPANVNADKDRTAIHIMIGSKPLD